jgi:hypothetical protein
MNLLWSRRVDLYMSVTGWIHSGLLDVKDLSTATRKPVLQSALFGFQGLYRIDGRRTPCG